MDVIAKVAELWRYPVKSMAGESCQTLHIGMSGAEGDRRFALRDASGKLGSGKSNRRFSRIEGLLDFQASLRGAVPRIRFPGGECLAGDDPDIHRALSAALDRSVTLVREEEGISHKDAEPVHLITSASLAWLQTLLPGATVDARRFRPNLVIALPGVDTLEQGWMDRRLRIGETVELEVSAPTGRCVMVNLAQSELPEEPQILERIAREADRDLGVYARVVVPGTINRGDPVRVE